VRLKHPAVLGTPLRWADVVVDMDRQAVMIRREMETTMAPDNKEAAA
jgi:hypothetical protein